LAVGVSLSVLALYGLVEVCGPTGLLQRYVIRLGQYSLLAYIAQIFVLQLLRHSLKEFSLSGMNAAAPLVIGIFATIAIVEATVWLRRRFAVIDRTYRLVFA
jgi:hypothetical protein